jgi:hypothetical protein
MTLLPIVGRELRVAARKRSTFWLRVVAALVALVLGGGFMAISAIAGMGTARLGGTLFGALTGLALAASLSAGLFFTSDALSEEKREGTLGFLFLTDLRGYDVAGGKLAATSLRGSYALLAFFPVLAITMLMGGVTGAQFWKATLALINALFCSLSAGLLVSSVSRDSQKALVATLFALLLLTAGGPLLDASYVAVRHTGPAPRMSLTSPFYVFSMASAGGRAYFWRGLLVSHLTGWALLGLAAALVPRAWQERSRKSTSTAWAYAWKYGRARFRVALRRRLLDRNPVRWVVSRERWQSTGLWGIALLAAGAFGLMAGCLPPMAWMFWHYVSWLLLLAVFLLTASQASRFFVEGQRNGLLELLLVTPVTSKEIVQGQWGGWWRMAALPALVLLALQGAGICLAQQATTRMTASTVGLPASRLVFDVVHGAVGALSVGADLLALSWFGMWMGLTSKKASLATFKTILFVQVIPWLVITFASTFIAILVLVPIFMNSGAFSGATTVTTNSATATRVNVQSVTVTSFVWSSSRTFTNSTVSTTTTTNLTTPSVPPAAVMASMGWLTILPLVMAGVAAVLTVAKDIGFLVWARRKLYSSFREQAIRSISPVAMTPPPLPPLRPPPIPVQTVIAGQP